MIKCAKIISGSKSHNLKPAKVKYFIVSGIRPVKKQEAQLMLTTGSTRLAVSRGQQTWYHFGFIASFRYACDRHHVGPTKKLTNSLRHFDSSSVL